MNPGDASRVLAIEPPGYHSPATVDFDRAVYCLLGLPFDAVNMNHVIRIVRSAASKRTPRFISTPNLNFLIACLADRQFRQSVINSDLSIADGMPLVWIARALGIPIQERVPGAGLFEALRSNTAQPLSVYFFGGPDGVAETACRRLNSESSGAHCTGFASPGFGSVADMSSNATIHAINASNADFLLVSLGAKKGQAWIEHNRAQISVPVISHLGAVVNFVAGRLKRAPPWLQRSGLEWLWRIKEEPGLWRRYFSDGLSLLHLLLTRVLPHCLFIRSHAPAQSELDAAVISVCVQDGTTLITLSGAWTQENLQPLRQCFAQAAFAGADVQIDLQQVPYIDAAFLGLLLLLYGHQQQHRHTLLCLPLNPQVRRIFKFACCEFLLQAGPSR